MVKILLLGCVLLVFALGYTLLISRIKPLVGVILIAATTVISFSEPVLYIGQACYCLWRILVSLLGKDRRYCKAYIRVKSRQDGTYIRGEKVYKKRRANFLEKKEKAPNGTRHIVPIDDSGYESYWDAIFVNVALIVFFAGLAIWSYVL